jgi:hypothetical protein
MLTLIAARCSYVNYVVFITLTLGYLLHFLFRPKTSGRAVRMAQSMFNSDIALIAYDSITSPTMRTERVVSDMKFYAALLTVDHYSPISRDLFAILLAIVQLG